MADKYVYDFSEGNKSMRELLGGKGANLAEMTAIGLPVPPGFTITTEVCTTTPHKGASPAGLEAQVESALALLEKDTGKKFGDPNNPLLLSRPLRRPGLHARHDGHHPQPRPQRHRRSRASSGRPATHASPRTATAASSACTATSSWAASRSKKDDGPVRGASRPEEEAPRRGLDTEFTADDLKELVAEFKRPCTTASARTSPRTRSSSSGAPSAPSSDPGTTTAPSPTAS